MKLVQKIVYSIPCHRRPERCFHVRGEPLPLCARCMSILLGFLFIPVLYLTHGSIPWWVGIVLQVPMLIDGFTQLFGWRESTNWLRTMTGLCSGFGLSVMVIFASHWLVQFMSKLFAFS